MGKVMKVVGVRGVARVMRVDLGEWKAGGRGGTRKRKRGWEKKGKREKGEGGRSKGTVLPAVLDSIAVVRKRTECLRNDTIYGATF